MNNTVIAIDPGFDGAVVALEETADHSINILEKMVMPTLGEKTNKAVDVYVVLQFLKRYHNIPVIIESVSSRPEQGVASMYRFGYNAGKLEGAIIGAGYRMIFVRPQEWQKVLRGYGRDGKPSQLYCSRMFPNTDWRASIRCRTPHDGLTDATCIGVWALKNLFT
jgi:hypothetical protein